MAGEIVLVADQMLPEAPLPEIIFATSVTDEWNPIARQGPTEARLNGPPTARVISVTRGQGPHRVQVIGKHDDGLDRERALAPHAAEDLPQELGPAGEKIRPAVAQGDGEEVDGARNAGAAIADHAADCARFRLSLVTELPRISPSLHPGYTSFAEMAAPGGGSKGRAQQRSRKLSRQAEQPGFASRTQIPYQRARC